MKAIVFSRRSGARSFADLKVRLRERTSRQIITNEEESYKMMVKEKTKYNKQIIKKKKRRTKK
jgi:hypothetical protein